MDWKLRKICNSPLETECSNIGIFEDNLCDQCKSELDCLHDAIYDATGKDLNYDQLSNAFLSLPDKLKLLSKEWGICDTVFREKVYELYKLKV